MPAGRLTLPLLVLALAVFVYGLYGFDGVLMRDYSIYLYSGQQMAEGVPPYVGIFDHKAPLSPMIVGLGVLLSKLLGSDDVLTVRLLFFATACMAVLAVFLLGKSVFRSKVVGFFAALTFLGFYPYGYPAASGPEPKTPMVLFEALSLLFMVKKRWFWAGLFASLAFLIWQPMVVFTLATLVLAVTRSKGERLGAGLRAVAGIATPAVAILAYFYYYGALGNLVDGALLFNSRYLTRGEYTTTPLVLQVLWDPSTILLRRFQWVILPYLTMLVPITIGLVMILRLYFRRPYQYRFAPFLLTLPAPFLWELIDLQLSDDLFVYLPYAAIGFGAFAAAVIRRAESPRFAGVFLGTLLLVIAVGNTFDSVNALAKDNLLGTDVTLSQQREGALEIENKFGPDAKIASVGAPQILVLLHRANPNPYLFITAGVDREIEAQWPGRFEGWVQSLRAYDPDVVTYFNPGSDLEPIAEATPEHQKELLDWLDSNYHSEDIGPWSVLVKGSLDNTGPPQEAQLTR